MEKPCETHHLGYPVRSITIVPLGKPLGERSLLFIPMGRHLSADRLFLLYGHYELHTQKDSISLSGC